MILRIFLPLYFQLNLQYLLSGSLSIPFREMEIARSLIELEKPAHTFYELTVNYPSMQIGKHSTVGVDTILGVVESI